MNSQKNFWKKQKYATVAGIIDGQSKYDDRIAIFSNIAKENRVKLLGYINSDISDILNGDELTEYWSNKTMINYSDKAYNALLKYNPKGLLHYYINNQTSNIDKIVNILQAINNTTIDQYETSDCEWEINRLSELYEDKNDRQLEQEMALSLMRGHIKCANNQCDRYYFYHLRDLFKLVNSRDKYLAHDIFEIQIPKEAYINKEKLFSMLDEINSKDKKVLAKIIANSMILLQNENEEEALFEYLERIDESDEVIKDIASAINLLEINGTRRNNKRRRINYKEIINNYKNKYPKAITALTLANKYNDFDKTHFEQIRKEYSLKEDKFIM